jgi:phosphoglucomutase
MDQLRNNEANKRYHHWVKYPNLPNHLKEELIQIESDPKEIEERFYKHLEFGTGGLRGVIGAGTNRINIYTVRKATQGLAQYINRYGEKAKEKGVAIAHDPRHQSKEFSEEAARVLAYNGIKVYLFDDLRPTPELSFAVRELGCIAGIVITASHNPPEYNGYKVYWEDGGQIPPETADAIIEEIHRVEDELSVSVISAAEATEKGLITVLGEDMDRRYISRLKGLVLNPEIIHQMADELKIVFTPLHGTGNHPVRRVLEEIGFNHVYVVPEQEQPDPDFSTVSSPNPEEHAAFTIAIELAKKMDADVIMGTDPDTDRVGFVVKDDLGEYRVLTGNQTGGLLLEYILSQRKQKGTLPKNGVVLKTIVTSQMGHVIADHYGVETVNTLTGFKFIGEKIKQYEKSGEKTFLFGYEESYGYLIGDFVRDKDAVQACLLGAEMAAYYKSKGLTLYQALTRLFDKYGYYQEDLVSITLKGIEGMKKIDSILERFRLEPPRQIAGVQVDIVRDYQSSKEYRIGSDTEETIDLPQSNVLHYTLVDGSWFCIRPSGTEPKIKIYFSVQDTTQEKSLEKLAKYKDDVLELIHH